MRNLILAGTTGLFVALGAIGAMASEASAPHYATGLPNYFSSRSPLMADHYGYDDRDTTLQMSEGRAAYIDGGAMSHPGAMANP